jgi:hypothetical protein
MAMASRDPTVTTLTYRACAEPRPSVPNARIASTPLRIVPVMLAAPSILGLFGRHPVRAA